VSRDVKDDFEKLVKFVEEYQLSNSLTKEKFIDLLSAQHKRYYALLTCIEEFNFQHISPFPSSYPERTQINREFHDILIESISDMGNAFFAWIHGGYKMSSVILRSSIENFLKAVGFTEFSDINKIKNVYEVIDWAGSISFYANEKNKIYFNILKDMYSELSTIVHTATVRQMEHLSSLDYFPHFDLFKAEKAATRFIKVANSYLATLCLMFKDCYVCMHYKNKDIILEVLVPEAKEQLVGGG
jgi:hypothetical protein